MDYNEWTMELFEELYPRYDLPHGCVQWNKNEGHLAIKWGNENLKLDLREFYKLHAHEDPARAVLAWIYNNVEPTEQELREAFFAYDYELDTYAAHVLRPLDTCRVIHGADPMWVKEQDQSRLDNIVQVAVNGSVINFTSTHSRIPVSTLLAYNKYTLGIIEHYMDYSPDLSIIVPDTNPLNNMFVGHADSIHRLGSDYPADRISIFTLGQWFDKTNERFES